MDKGEEKYGGTEIAHAIDLYYTRFTNNVKNIIYSDGSIELSEINILNADSYLNDLAQIKWGGNLIISFRFKIKGISEVPKFSINIFDKEQRPIALLQENKFDSDIKIRKNELSFIVEHRNIQLSKGIYFINLHVSYGKIKAPILRINDVLKFQVLHPIDVWHPLLLSTTFQGCSTLE